MKWWLFLTISAGLVGRLSAGSISTIEELDAASVFHFSIMSDLGATCGANSFSSAVTVKGLEWMKSSEFVMGGGDEIKVMGTQFAAFLRTNTYYKANFYPCIGGGENRAYGGADTVWGSGSLFITNIPNFWSRPGVFKSTEPQDAYGNTSSYYATYTKKRGQKRGQSA
ncbi:MAG: hypothetical protein MUC65_06715 [Pontiellaceae bacterium]|nr:hypothetical protein [Pontiellaceae bacterium]